MQATIGEIKPKKKITFDKINRRTHLYLAMFLLPWFLVYGLSSVVFNHPMWFARGPYQWYVLMDREYTLPPVPDDMLRPIAEKILKDSGFSGQFAVLRNSEGNIQVNQNRFLDNTQLIYNPQTSRLVVRREVFRWISLIMRL